MSTLQTWCISGKLDYIEVFTQHRSGSGTRTEGLHSHFWNWSSHNKSCFLQLVFSTQRGTCQVPLLLECENFGIILFSVLWLIHTAREWDQSMEQDWQYRKQWVLVPIAVSRHFCVIYQNPLIPFLCNVIPLIRCRCVKTPVSVK